MNENALNATKGQSQPRPSATDRELLSAYLRGDQEAFGVLFGRHHSLVNSVCMRMLRHREDAEDATQSVFLIMIKSARKLRGQVSLAAWLHNVARKVSLYQRRSRCNRARRETKAVGGVRESVGQEGFSAELDEALAELPKGLRLPLILHDVEGYTLPEISRLLNCKRTTISTRISRGREKLRERLARRGVVLSLAGMVSLLSESTWAKAPSSTFVQTCSQTAMGLAQNRPIADLVGINVQTLTKGVLHMMFLTKLKMLAIGCLALAIISGGMVIVSPQTSSAVQAASAVPGRYLQGHRRPCVGGGLKSGKSRAEAKFRNR